MNFNELNLTNGCFGEKMCFVEQELQNTDEYIRLQKRKDELFKKIKASANFENWLLVDELISIKNEEFVSAAELFYKLGVNDAFGALPRQYSELKDNMF